MMSISDSTHWDIIDFKDDNLLTKVVGSNLVLSDLQDLLTHLQDTCSHQKWAGSKNFIQQLSVHPSFKGSVANVRYTQLGIGGTF